MFVSSKLRTVSQPCWRSGGDINVDHSKVFWLCPKSVKFWEGVHRVIVRILGYGVTKSCTLLCSGILTGNVALKEDRYLLKL